MKQERKKAGKHGVSSLLDAKGVGGTGLEQRPKSPGKRDVLSRAGAKSGAVGAGGLSYLMAEATMWITRCQAVVDDFRSSQSGVRDEETRQQARATLEVLGDLRRVVVGAEKMLQGVLKATKHSPHS